MSVFTKGEEGCTIGGFVGLWFAFARGIGDGLHQDGMQKVILEKEGGER